MAADTVSRCRRPGTGPRCREDTEAAVVVVVAVTVPGAVPACPDARGIARAGGACDGGREPVCTKVGGDAE
jgi:hypothetical protein